MACVGECCCNGGEGVGSIFFFKSLSLLKYSENLCLADCLYSLSGVKVVVMMEAKFVLIVALAMVVIIKICYMLLIVVVVMIEVLHVVLVMGLVIEEIMKKFHYQHML